MAPTWFRVYQPGQPGSRGTRPKLCFKPTTPQKEEGILMDPPPSLPMATAHRPAATAAADPPLEPPGVRVWSTGFAVAP